MAEVSAEVRRALGVVRVIWLAAAGSQVLALVGVVAAVGQPVGVPQGPYRLLLAASIALLVLGTMLAYFTRNQLYKRYWQEHAIAPKGYIAGNAVLLAVLAGASTLALVSAVLVNSLLPYVLISGIALVLMLLNIPRGRPMLPHEPRLGARW